MSTSEYALDRRVKLLRRKLANARHTADADSDICSFTNEITEEQRANARLIAAAPKLLYALKRAAKWIAREAEGNDEMPQTLTFAEAVIAKAEGRS